MQPHGTLALENTWKRKQKATLEHINNMCSRVVKSLKYRILQYLADLKNHTQSQAIMLSNCIQDLKREALAGDKILSFCIYYTTGAAVITLNICSHSLHNAQHCLVVTFTSCATWGYPVTNVLVTHTFIASLKIDTFSWCRITSVAVIIFWWFTLIDICWKVINRIINTPHSHSGMIQ